MIPYTPQNKLLPMMGFDEWVVQARQIGAYFAGKNSYTRESTPLQLIHVGLTDEATPRLAFNAIWSREPTAAEMESFADSVASVLGIEPVLYHEQMPSMQTEQGQAMRSMAMGPHMGPRRGGLN